MFSLVDFGFLILDFGERYSLFTFHFSPLRLGVKTGDFLHVGQQFS